MAKRRPRRGHQPDGAAAHRRARRGTRLPARRLSPAPWPRSRSSTGSSRSPATGSTRSSYSPWTPTRSSRGCCSGPRPQAGRRHRGRRPAPPGGVRRQWPAADRCLPPARDRARDRQRHGRGRRRDETDLRRARRRAPVPRLRHTPAWASSLRPGKSRPRPRST